VVILKDMRAIGFFLFIFLSMSAPGQELRIKSVTRVRPEDNGSYMLTGTVPDSRLLLVTAEGYKGLSLLDSKKGKIRKISSDPGAGYEPAVTEDGKSVIYRSDVFSEQKKYTSLYNYNLVTGETVTLLDKERGVLPAAVSGNRILIKSDSKSMVEMSGSAALKGTGDDIFIVIENLVPVLYTGGERKPLRPSGEGYYIWVSLSPDRSKIVYNFQGRNTFICNTEGRILYDAGRINAPKWLNDNIIIGMDDKDDGHRVVSSEIVYFSLPAGKRSNLTDTGTRTEMYPFPVSGGSRLAFCTDKGEIYIMKIRVR
jgi:Tol biopolymer transport system component